MSAIACEVRLHGWGGIAPTIKRVNCNYTLIIPFVTLNTGLRPVPHYAVFNKNCMEFLHAVFSSFCVQHACMRESYKESFITIKVAVTKPIYAMINQSHLLWFSLPWDQIRAILDYLLETPVIVNCCCWYSLHSKQVYDFITIINSPEYSAKINISNKIIWNKANFFDIWNSANF